MEIFEKQRISQRRDLFLGTAKYDTDNRIDRSLQALDGWFIVLSVNFDSECIPFPPCILAHRRRKGVVNYVKRLHHALIPLFQHMRPRLYSTSLHSLHSGMLSSSRSPFNVDIMAGTLGVGFGLMNHEPQKICFDSPFRPMPLLNIQRLRRITSKQLFLASLHRYLCPLPRDHPLVYLGLQGYDLLTRHRKGNRNAKLNRSIFPTALPLNQSVKNPPCLANIAATCLERIDHFQVRRIASVEEILRHRLRTIPSPGHIFLPDLHVLKPSFGKPGFDVPGTRPLRIHRRRDLEIGHEAPTRLLPRRWTVAIMPSEASVASSGSWGCCCLRMVARTPVPQPLSNALVLGPSSGRRVETRFRSDWQGVAVSRSTWM